MEQHKPTPANIPIAPSLDKEERDLVLLLRTLKEGIVEVSVANGKPLSASVRYPEMLNRQQVGSYPLSKDERDILNLVKFISFGRLALHVTDQGKYQVLADSEQKFKLGFVDWSDWV